MSDKQLIDSIDEAATALLLKVRRDGTLPQDEKPDLFVEEIKAFQAVVEWAKARHAISPPPEPEKGPSKYDGLKRQFNGEKAGRGRGRAAAATDGGDAAGLDSPSAASSSIFDA